MKLRILIKPNSKHREGVEELPDGSYVLYTKQPTTEGRANTSAVKILAKYFGVSKSQVKLVSGATSRHKRFEVEI